MSDMKEGRLPFQKHSRNFQTTQFCFRMASPNGQQFSIWYNRFRMKHSPHFCNHKIAKIKTRIGVLNCWNASRLIFDKNHEQGYLVLFQYNRSLYYSVFRHLQIQTMKLIPAVEIINRWALFAEISTYHVTCKISRRTISLREYKKYFILIW